MLKFGGTSVSSAANWHNIAGVLRERIAEGLRPVVVHSALSGVTDRLESLLAAALGRRTLAPALAGIEASTANSRRAWGSSRASASRDFSRS